MNPQHLVVTGSKEVLEKAAMGACQMDIEAYVKELPKVKAGMI